MSIMMRCCSLPRSSRVLIAFTVFSFVMLFFFWVLVEFISKTTTTNNDGIGFSNTADADSLVKPVGISKALQTFQSHGEATVDGLFDIDKYLLSEKIPLVIARRINKEKPETDGPACVFEPTISDCNNIGFAALLLETLDSIGYCQLMGATPTVFWRNCNSVCSKDKQINSWEWYFEPVNPGIQNQARKVLCLGSLLGPDQALVGNSNRIKVNDTFLTPMSLLNLSFQRRSFAGYIESGIITQGARHWAYSLITKYVKVNINITRSVDNFYKKYMAGHKLLAVHIRGTDHINEVESHILTPVDVWIKNAEHILKSLPSPKKLFIASDNGESIKMFLAHFGRKVVVFTKAVRAISYHGSPVHDSGFDPFTIGSQVLVDMLLMAKCDHFLHAESSVASLVSFFNPDLFTHFLASQIPKQKAAIPVNRLERRNEFTESKSTLQGNNTNSKFLEENKREIERNAECFKENAPYSVCPNMAKGIFINARELNHFFKN